MTANYVVKVSNELLEELKGHTAVLPPNMHLIRVHHELFEQDVSIVEFRDDWAPPKFSGCLVDPELKYHFKGPGKVGVVHLKKLHIISREYFQPLPL